MQFPSNIYPVGIDPQFVMALGYMPEALLLMVIMLAMCIFGTGLSQWLRYLAVGLTGLMMLTLSIWLLRHGSTTDVGPTTEAWKHANSFQGWIVSLATDVGVLWPLYVFGAFVAVSSRPQRVTDALPEYASM
jgi:hypothetical protein